MVITKEIPRARWRSVLDDLSRLHAGAPARLVVLDAAQGVQTHGDTFRLVGLTADGDVARASIAAILDGPSHLTHIIDHPASMHVELLWETRTANVQITAGDGTRTLIALGPPVLAAAPRHGCPVAGAAAATGGVPAVATVPA